MSTFSCQGSMSAWDAKVERIVSALDADGSGDLSAAEVKVMFSKFVGCPVGLQLIQRALSYSDHISTIINVNNLTLMLPMD